MKNRFTTLVGLALTLALVAAPLSAQLQQSNSPIDDLLKRAQDAFNDLNYTRADSLARQVLAIGSRISPAQRTGALLVIAAAAYPEEASAQHRAVALSTLKQLVRTNLNLKMPQELTWAGLDSLLDEARRTTFAMEVTGDSAQTVTGPQGTATLRVRGSRPGRYYLTIMPAAGGPAVVIDSTSNVMIGEFRFAAMRHERPIFSTGEYSIVVTGVDSLGADSVTARYTARMDAPALEFVNIPAKLDSSKLLPDRTGRFGGKAIFPALLVGGASFALASVLRGEGDIKTKVGADSRGIMVGGALALSTVVVGFADHGRQIPANIAANKAFGEAFQKAVIDAQAENRRRIAQHTTTIRLESEVR